jgi:transposase
MAKIYHVDLTEQERQHLNALLKNNNQNTERAKRCYILLAADNNGDKKWKDDEISQCYRVGVSTVARLRKRFIEGGLQEALYGKKKKIEREKIFDGRVEANLIALRCSKVPTGHSGWSLRLLSDKMVELNYVESISHESVRQILKKTQLSPGELKVG